MRISVPCPSCDGKGFHSIITDTSASCVRCSDCDGTGQIERNATHLEHIKSYDAAQFAHFIIDVTQKCACEFCADTHCRGASEDIVRCIKGICMHLATEVPEGGESIARAD